MWEGAMKGAERSDESEGEGAGHVAGE
jgi:hypothetical protein